MEKSSVHRRLKSCQALVEKVYTSCFLDPLAVRWCQSLSHNLTTFQTERQTHFYSKNVSGTRERVVVFISDAMRYEVAQQLFEKLAMDAKCTAKLTPGCQHSALLYPARHGGTAASCQSGASARQHCDHPRKENGRYRCTGKHPASGRENSSCIQFDQMQNMRRDELRSYFSGKTLVYVYHNQIDARGDEARTENEVFSACEEAVEELYKEIRRLTDNANIRHFIVTADHGFLYKHDPDHGERQGHQSATGGDQKQAFYNF